MRVLTRLFCAVLAAALVAVGVTTMVGVVASLTAPLSWPVDTGAWLDDLTTEPWSSFGHRLALLGGLAAGIVLLLAAWMPRRPVALPSSDGIAPDGVAVTLRRRAVEDRIAAHLRSLPYVVDATVRADRTIDIVAQSTRGDDPAVRQTVETAVAESVERLGLNPDATRVRVRKSAGRAA